jgi:hypothetical protein
MIYSSCESIMRVRRSRGPIFYRVLRKYPIENCFLFYEIAQGV